MTTLYFVQHGLSHGSDIDKSRPLTEEGSQQAINIAKHLHTHHIKINSIYHSGKLRAQQTAKLFAQALAVDTVAKLNGMDPKDDADSFIAQLNEDCIMYVGHLPHLDKVVSRLLTGDSKKSPVQFQNATVACVQKQADDYRLQWYLTRELC